MADFIRTHDLADEAELRELFSMEPDDGELSAVVKTHDGDWRHEENNPGYWRFWRYEDA